MFWLQSSKWVLKEGRKEIIKGSWRFRQFWKGHTLSQRMMLGWKLNPTEIVNGGGGETTPPATTQGCSRCCWCPAGQPADSRANVGESALSGGPRHLARRQEDSAAGGGEHARCARILRAIYTETCHTSNRGNLKSITTFGGCMLMWFFSLGSSFSLFLGLQGRLLNLSCSTVPTFVLSITATTQVLVDPLLFCSHC